MANPADLFRNPQPFFLSLKKDIPKASRLSQRMKRAVQEDDELAVFAAEQYFSGALDVLKPCKTSPQKEFSFPRPPPPTSNEFLEPTVASFMGWIHPVFSLLSCIRKAPPSSEENDNSIPKTRLSTQEWNQRSTSATNRKMRRSLGTVTVDPDVDIYSESSSELFELDTLSLRACPSVVQKSHNYSVPGDSFRKETAAPIECGLLQVGCWGRRALDVAVGVHTTAVKQRSKNSYSKSRPVTPRLSPPISVLSLR